MLEELIKVERFRVNISGEEGQPPVTQAIVKIKANGREVLAVAECETPVGALSSAILKALREIYGQDFSPVIILVEHSEYDVQFALPILIDLFDKKIMARHGQKV